MTEDKDMPMEMATPGEDVLKPAGFQVEDGHGVRQCVHGTVVLQCRCVDGHGNVTIVPCPVYCEHYVVKS